MKKCINCGKMFENKDKRVKRCDTCRFGEDKEKKMKVGIVIITIEDGLKMYSKEIDILVVYVE